MILLFIIMKICNMDSLPNEVTFEILKDLSINDLINFIKSSKNNIKWLNDIQLWKFYANKILGYPTDLFDVRLQDISSPYHLYKDLSICQDIVSLNAGLSPLDKQVNSLDDPNRDPDMPYLVEDPHKHELRQKLHKRCSNSIVKGTSFCKIHCAKHDILVCNYCEEDVCEEDIFENDIFISRFCKKCSLSNIYEEGCENIITDGIWKNYTCYLKKEIESSYCKSCNKNKSLNDSKSKLIVYPLSYDTFRCENPELFNVIIKRYHTRSENKLLAVGKKGSSGKMYFLNDREKNIARSKGLFA